MSDGGWGSGPWGGSAWGKSYFLPTVSEAAAGADAPRQGFLVDRSVSEGATLTETPPDARQRFFCVVDEDVLATDNAPLAGWAYNIVVLEGATAQDRVVARMRFEARLTESLVARDPLRAKYLWDPVNDNQNAGWQNVPDAQTPGWTDVIDSQSPRWRDTNA